MTATLTYDFTAVNRTIQGRIGPRTREAWHTRVANELWPLLEAAGGTRPTVMRYSTGFLGNRGISKTAIGVCYRPEASADGSTQVYLSPVIGDAFVAADTLAHELVHACPESGSGHGKEFKKLATAFGLVGPMRSAGAGPELAAIIHAIIERVGPYPHAELGTGEAADKPKKQTTRQRKVMCPECVDEPYIVRMSQATIDRGCPTCPCGALMVEETPEESESE